MKIGQKLILGFVVVPLLIGVVGYISVNTSQKVLQKSIGESSVRLAQETLDAIDRIIYRRIEIWESYDYANPKLSETIKASNQEFEKLDNIQTYINKKDKEWTSAPKKGITPFMQELINNKSSQRLKKRIDFYEKKYGYKIFGEVFVTNKYGANIVQSGKTSDYYQADEEWWQVAKKDGFYIRDVEYDESADIYSADFALRVVDEAGNFLGVTKVVLNIEEMVNIMKKARDALEYKTVSLELWTKEGKLIYGTEPGHELFEDVAEFALFEEKGEHKDFFITVEPGEKEKLLAHAHSKSYRDYKGLGWILVVEYETEEIFAPATNLRNTILIISLVIILLAILIGFFISHTISAPVTKLRDTAVEIGNGDLSKRAEIKSKDEIGDLANSFNQMADEVQKRNEELQTMNEELRSTNEELETSNEELQSTTEELVQKEKLAAVGQLASGVGHELRNPLGVIKNAAYFIKTRIGTEDPKLVKHLNIMEREINNSNKIISDLLGFSRARPPAISPQNINRIVENSLEVVEVPENVKVVKELGADLPNVMTDPDQIRQVFVNLSLNAIQAMAEGGEFKISTRREGDFIETQFSDTGCGIPEEDLKRLFDPFFTTKAKGIGLGLAVTQGIIERHNGTIDVKSGVDKGTTFLVKLPIEKKRV